MLKITHHLPAIMACGPMRHFIGFNNSNLLRSVFKGKIRGGNTSYPRPNHGNISRKILLDFLIERLENIGVKHVFGIPGDYVLDFYSNLWQNDKIKVINTTDENHAGFAADAYARVNGVGCVCVTYNVGASKLINSVQCAYAERSPVIVISGSPGLKERDEGVLLHHMVGSFNSQKEMFDKITSAIIVLPFRLYFSHSVR
jgi:hypothetical protein